MKKLFKLIVFVVFVVVALTALAAFVSMMDADKYRPQLAEMLSKKTGREVKLNGSIDFSLGLRGVRVSIEDAAIANPEGASRHNLASVGKMEFGLDALPLIEHHLSINELSIEGADILLETDEAGHQNWNFGNNAPQEEKKEGSSSLPSARKVSLSIENLKIVNSQIGWRGADGKHNGANISSLSLGMNGSGAEMTFDGDIDGVPLTAHAKMSFVDLLNLELFSADIEATYDVLRFEARGKIDLKNGKAEFPAYAVKAGDSKIRGAFEATWNGACPTLRGTLISDRLNWMDFKSGALTTNADGKTSAASEEQTPVDKRLFSNRRLPFDALNAVDAALNVEIGSFPVNDGALKNLKAKLVLSGGKLMLEPVNARIGDTPVEVRIALNASSAPAHLDFGMISNGVDLSDLQKLSGMLSFMTGKAGANIQLAGNGNSAHDIASSLGGIVEVTAEKGEIFTGVAANISSLLAPLFNASGDDSALNCLAARFIAKNGVLTDNGILIDSAASTVSGKGAIDLVSETVNLSLHARSKLVDIGGLIPSMQIEGDVSDPSYSVNGTGVVKGVIGNLMNGNVDIVSSNVPEIQNAPAGQNACVYTLDHPKMEASSGILPVDMVGRASQKIQNIGKSLVKGLLKQ